MKIRNNAAWKKEAPMVRFDNGNQKRVLFRKFAFHFFP